ncbi:MAG: recombinase family protein [Acidimicrobiales bacterium]
MLGRARQGRRRVQVGPRVSPSAQREACTRHVRDAGWLLADEYVDRGESARSADRPALKAMLARIAEDRDVDAVVVDKIDRLARNMEDHVAIHALMAEFYSANVANEIKKGLNQKVKQGSFPRAAPLGYVNLREVVGGRQVARIVPDPERAPLITGAFDRHATGEWTLQGLAGELAHQGLTNLGQRGKSPTPITWQRPAEILANPVYIGVVVWNGVQCPGTHEPLLALEVFRLVRELLAARADRGTREREHPPLEGLLHCGVCGRRLSIQHSKGRYTCLFCLGQKNDPAGTSREPCVAADVAQRELFTDGLAKSEGERRKLLDAYYGEGIDVPTLKTEQTGIDGVSTVFEYETRVEVMPPDTNREMPIWGTRSIWDVAPTRSWVTQLPSVPPRRATQVLATAAHPR